MNTSRKEVEKRAAERAAGMQKTNVNEGTSGSAGSAGSAGSSGDSGAPGNVGEGNVGKGNVGEGSRSGGWFRK